MSAFSAAHSEEKLYSSSLPREKERLLEKINERLFCVLSQRYLC